MTTTQIKAPFTPEQVLALNRWQNAGYIHEFTCANRGDGKHGDGNGVLIATVRGWICQFCDYEQDWCHEVMTHPLPRNDIFDDLMEKALTPREIVMRKICECGHFINSHAINPDLMRGACLADDCTCTTFEWDGDMGGVAVTKSTRQIAEQTVERVRGSRDVPGFEACVEAELAEMLAKKRHD